ncbi:chorismate synthase [uncultured Alloprevotella sp.]|uniref:chorismate synthase n=1 Tax=uncultured Alloprevotella sp. TaxID=1283315 RepID=UPI00261C2D13|nr:chorismate synthase [uncultured Alloprevotella sp.]
MNTFGHLFRLTSFGESHGEAIGGIVDGFPAGIFVDEDFIAGEMARRRPGQSDLTTARQEADRVQLLSGIFEGRSTGCPIGFMIRNEAQHSQDYAEMREAFRPSHADYTYRQKYGLYDYRGGGRASARETAVRVVGGALAKLALREAGISVGAYTSQIGSIALPYDYRHYDVAAAETNAVRCPDAEKAEEMAALIRRVKAEGDTVGGVVTGLIRGCPAGLGEPVFEKLHAALGAAMLSINAAKGFEYGEGFAAASGRGSELNDAFIPDEQGGITTQTNHSGGIQGGISNGQTIYFRVAFKPVATLLHSQPTVNLQAQPILLQARGRHDPCVVPRAVPIVEAMAAMTILDYYLQSKTTRI